MAETPLQVIVDALSAITLLNFGTFNHVFIFNKLMECRANNSQIVQCMHNNFY